MTTRIPLEITGYPFCVTMDSSNTVASNCMYWTWANSPAVCNGYAVFSPQWAELLRHLSRWVERGLLNSLHFYQTENQRISWDLALSNELREQSFTARKTESKCLWAIELGKLIENHSRVYGIAIFPIKKDCVEEKVNSG